MEQLRFNLNSKKRSLRVKVTVHYDGMPRKPIINPSPEISKQVRETFSEGWYYAWTCTRTDYVDHRLSGSLSVLYFYESQVN